jgi:hypothetical protein
MPFQGRALGTGFWVLPEEKVYQGQEGQMSFFAASKDIADPALSHSACRLPGLWVAVAPGPSEGRIPTLSACASASIQLRPPASSTCSALPWRCTCCSHLALHTLAFTQDSYFITNHFEYHDYRLIYFFYFKGWCRCAQGAAISISTFAKASECEMPITGLT